MVKIGEKRVNDYLTNLKDEHNKQINSNKHVIDTAYLTDNEMEYISFTKFKEIWIKSNPDLVKDLNNNLYARLGGRIIDLLEYAEFIKKVIHINEEKNTEYILETQNPEEIHKSNPKFTLPTKLPMVIIPKPYSHNKLGGYLLNDDKYADGLIIDKHGYKYNSTIAKKNHIYDMVNSISSRPFKINKSVLDYINLKGVEQNLIIDVSAEHELEKLEVLKPLQKRKLVSYNSTKLLQETILGIVEFYSNFDRFYFPVRLDQRGRLYCTPNYFNYQSNELAKSLL